MKCIFFISNFDGGGSKKLLNYAGRYYLNSEKDMPSLRSLRTGQFSVRYFRKRGLCVNYQMALCRLQVIGVIKTLHLCLLDSLSDKDLNGFKEEF